MTGGPGRPPSTRARPSTSDRTRFSSTTLRTNSSSGIAFGFCSFPAPRTFTATVPCSASRRPDDEHVRHLHARALGDAVLERLGARVEVRAHAGIVERLVHLVRVLEVLVRDRQHPHLLRGKPHRERAGEVLGEDRDEALERAAHGAMDHHRTMVGVVLADVLEVEALRRVVVELDRAELPRAADRVGDVEVDLRTVKGAVTRLELVRHARRLERGTQRRLGAIPERVVADTNLGAGREPDGRAQAERLVVAEDEFDEKANLVLDLVLGDEDVAIVLLELPHAREARERARHLVPVQHVERHVAERQLAVRVLLREVEQIVRRAVHRLQREVVLLGLAVENEEHVLAILAPMSRDLPQPLVVHEGRPDLVKIVALPLADEIGDRVVQHRAALGPEHGAGRERVHHEQVELLAEHAMVALLRLLDAVRGARPARPS